MIIFEVDISLLTSEGIQMKGSFREVKDLNSSSMNDKLLMIEMLILLINSFNNGAGILDRMTSIRGTLQSNCVPLC